MPLDYSIPKHNKNKFFVDTILSTDLEKIMYATLETKVEMPVTSQNHFHRWLIVKLHKHTSEATYKLNEKQQEKYPIVGPEFIAKDLKENILKEIKEYEKLGLEPKKCTLKGEELIICYFDKVFEKLEANKEEEKKAIEKKYVKISKLVKANNTRELDKIKNEEIKELDIKYGHWKTDLKNLEKFVLEQKEKQIMVYVDKCVSFTTENLQSEQPINEIQEASNLLKIKDFDACKSHTDILAIVVLVNI